VRARALASDAPQRPALDKVVRVSFLYAPHSDGLPQTAAVFEEMAAFEDLMVGRVERPGLGLKVSAITGAGKRKFHYYTRDAEALLRAVILPLAARFFPVELEWFDAPEWEEIRKLNRQRAP